MGRANIQNDPDQVQVIFARDKNFSRRSQLAFDCGIFRNHLASSTQAFAHAFDHARAIGRNWTYDPKIPAGFGGVPDLSA